MGPHYISESQKGDNVDRALERPSPVAVWEIPADPSNVHVALVERQPGPFYFDLILNLILSKLGKMNDLKHLQHRDMAGKYDGVFVSDRAASRR